MTIRRRWPMLFTVFAGALVLSACASDNEPNPNTTRARDNSSCKETRRELDRLDAKGVPASIEAANSGKKLGNSQRADVDRYNRLLQDYLGSRCHL